MKTDDLKRWAGHIMGREARPNIIPIHALRREAELPEQPFWDPRPILEIAGGMPKLSHLKAFEAADLSEDAGVIDLLPIDRDAFRDLDIPAIFGEKTAAWINVSTAERAMRLRLYRDVHFAEARGRFLIWRDGQIDIASSALPTTRRLADPDRHFKVRHFARAFFCGDRFEATNPAHGVFDHLARAALVTGAGLFSDHEILRPGPAASIVDTIAEGISADWHVGARNDVFHIDELYVLQTSLGRQRVGHPFMFGDPRSFHPVLAAARQCAGPDTSGLGGRIIYLSRLAAHRRRLMNEPDLVDALTARGVEIVEMADLDGVAQLSTFRNARLVVAPHGAALAAQVAGGPDSRILELCHPTNATMAFRLVSHILGARHRQVFGIAATDTVHASPWCIDIEAVLRGIEDMLRL